MLNKLNSIIFSDKNFLKKIRYNKKGYYRYSKESNKKYKVTVVIPSFNAELTIKKAIDSVINQSMDFQKIQVLCVDDFSTDETRLILLNYAKQYDNIEPVFLKSNTGSPSAPRNIGIDLAQGEYITFLDSDDWLHEDGLLNLVAVLDETEVDYVVGKTMKVTEKGQYIVGEYNSIKKRTSIKPTSIRHVFQHLGPTARMMKTNLIKENNIKFPNMRYAEDKRFFIDVLTNCNTISTTDDIIYYANRYKTNESFTTKTSIFEKTQANIAVMKYVLEKELPIATEKMIMNRLIEFDCITRLFNRNHFLKSDKKSQYFGLFAEVMELCKSLRYDFKENLFHPWHKTLVLLFLEKRYDDIVKLIRWNRSTPMKEMIIENNYPYIKLPFDSNSEYSKVREVMYAQFEKSCNDGDKLVLDVSIYGDYLDEINDLIILDRHNELNSVSIPLYKREKNLFTFVISYNMLESLSKVSHAIYVRYNQYEKAFIRMNTRDILTYKKMKIDFYTTIGDNFALSIK